MVDVPKAVSDYANELLTGHACGSENAMSEQATPKIVPRDEWERARAELLVREKAHTRAGDELAAARRRLPMTRMEPVMVTGPNGPVPLNAVFEDRRMLMVYHFMWKKGAPHHKQCEGCTHSQTAMNSAVRAYLAARDVTYAVFSSGPLDELMAYRDFMGWTQPWYSTADSGNALATRDGGDLRCYLRVGDEVFETYATKWRGIEAMLPTLQLLDLTAYGRQETWEDSPAGWPQEKAGSWWRQDGRPVAQWTRTNEAVK
ncbi:MAG: hypothetical protein JWM11_5524 [Planctomycetaceae bacterium]|nr:hypothetical protein [Planctomycetaceae bacterium]